MLPELIKKLLASAFIEKKLWPGAAVHLCEYHGTDAHVGRQNASQRDQVVQVHLKLVLALTAINGDALLMKKELTRSNSGVKRVSFLKYLFQLHSRC